MASSYATSNRTYLVVTVFGYNSAVGEATRQLPYASLACLCPAGDSVSKCDPSDNGTVLSPTTYSHCDDDIPTLNLEV